MTEYTEKKDAEGCVRADQDWLILPWATSEETSYDSLDLCKVLLNDGPPQWLLLHFLAEGTVS